MIDLETFVCYVWTISKVILMYKAYRFGMYPNDEQRILINKTFGCTRFIYNYFLDKCKRAGNLLGILIG